MLSTIWVSAEWAEVLFLVAAVVFVAASVAAGLARDLGWMLANAGLALVAFGLLAL